MAFLEVSQRPAIQPAPVPSPGGQGETLLAVGALRGFTIGRDRVEKPLVLQHGLASHGVSPFVVSTKNADSEAGVEI